MTTGKNGRLFQQLVSEATDLWLDSGVDSPAKFAQEVVSSQDFPIEEAIAAMYRQAHSRRQEQSSLDTPFSDFYAFLAACDRVGITPAWEEGSDAVHLLPAERHAPLRVLLGRTCPDPTADPLRLAVAIHRDRIRRQVQLERERSVAARAAGYGWMTAVVDLAAQAITWALSPADVAAPPAAAQPVKRRPVFGEPSSGRVA